MMTMMMTTTRTTMMMMKNRELRMRKHTSRAGNDHRAQAEEDGKETDKNKYGATRETQKQTKTDRVNWAKGS